MDEDLPGMPMGGSTNDIGDGNYAGNQNSDSNFCINDPGKHLFSPNGAFPVANRSIQAQLAQLGLQQGQFNDLLPAGGQPSGADYRMAQGLASDGKNLALGSNIAFGVGGAALVAGARLLWRDRVRPLERAVTLAPRTAPSPSAGFRVPPVASFAAGATGVTGPTAGIQARY